MPLYTSTADVVAVTGTTLSATTVLPTMIDLAEGILVGFLSAKGLPQTACAQLRAAACTKAVIYVIQRHRMDGTMPGSITIGKLNMSDDLNGAIKILEQSYQDIINGYEKQYPADLRSTEAVEQTNIRSDDWLSFCAFDQTPKYEAFDGATLQAPTQNDTTGDA